MVIFKSDLGSRGEIIPSAYVHTGARMTRIAKSELHGDPLLSIDALLARVDAVTEADVARVAGDLLSGPATLAVIGPFDETTTFNAVA